MADAAVVLGSGIDSSDEMETAQGEMAAMVGRGSLVFLGGMALAAASFFVERAVVRAIRRA